MRVRAKALGLDPNKRYEGLIPDDGDAPEPKGLQGPFGPSPTPDWDYYWPTRTSQPDRKYTQMARYSRTYRCLEVIFRDNTPWHWTNIGEDFWIGFKRSNLERPTYDYIHGVLRAVKGDGSVGGWGSIVGEACQ